MIFLPQMFLSAGFEMRPQGIVVLHPEDAAHIANAELSRWRESLPVMYGLVDGNWSDIKESGDTHRARRAFVEEIKAVVECEHSCYKPAEPQYMDNDIWHCVKCNRDLKATWSAVEGSK
jgi:hypothetical protein